MSLALSLRPIYQAIQRSWCVTCVKCGFLAYGSQEVTSTDRFLLFRKSIEVDPMLKLLHCHCSLWAGYDLDLTNGTKLDVVNELGRCKGFLPYNPGLSPAEHMEHLAKAEARKAQFKYSLLAAIIGSILTLLGLWVARHFGFSKYVGLIFRGFGAANLISLHNYAIYLKPIHSLEWCCDHSMRRCERYRLYCSGIIPPQLGEKYFDWRLSNAGIVPSSTSTIALLIVGFSMPPDM